MTNPATHQGGVEPGYGGARPTRRELVRRGTKLVYVAPFLSTFLAKQAQAKTTNHSCYPANHACPGAEPCCSGVCNLTMCAAG
jgi:hypothetical protein